MGASAVTTQMAKDTSSACFLDLPTELKLQILSNLAVRQILRPRLVSRHLRELVDEPGNQRSLFETLQSLHQTRLRCLVAGLVFFDTAEPIITTFARHVAHRGLCYLPRHRRLMSINFVLHWESINGRKVSLRPGHPDYNGYVFCVRILLSDLLGLHIRYHIREEEIVIHSPYDLNLRDPSGRTLQALRYLQMTKDDLDEILRDIQHQPGGIFTRDVCRKPKFISANKPIVFDIPSDIKIASLLGIPDISAMHSDLGTGDALDRGFHYYVEDDWARARLRRAIDGDELSAVEKAFVLERTYLH